MPEQDKTNNWFLMKEKFYSKILFILLLSLLMILISSSYYKYIIKEDFILYAEVSCDPSFESCFIYECSEEDENCDSNDPNQYYKIIYISDMLLAPLILMHIPYH